MGLRQLYNLTDPADDDAEDDADSRSDYCPTCLADPDILAVPGIFTRVPPNARWLSETIERVYERASTIAEGIHPGYPDGIHPAHADQTPPPSRGSTPRPPALLLAEVLPCPTRTTPAFLYPVLPMITTLPGGRDLPPGECPPPPADPRQFVPGRRAPRAAPPGPPSPPLTDFLANGRWAGPPPRPGLPLPGVAGGPTPEVYGHPATYATYPSPVSPHPQVMEEQPLWPKPEPSDETVQGVETAQTDPEVKIEEDEDPSTLSMTSSTRDWYSIIGVPQPRRLPP